MDKNQYVYECITGRDADGNFVGAESDGWRDRISIEEADQHYTLIVCGDFGQLAVDELEACDGEFSAAAVVELLKARKEASQ